jgi:hypothetical protein
VHTCRQLALEQQQTVAGGLGLFDVKTGWQIACQQEQVVTFCFVGALFNTNV